MMRSYSRYIQWKLIVSDFESGRKNMEPLSEYKNEGPNIKSSVFFRYRNHPKNLLVSYLSTHPTSTSTSIFKESIYEPYLKSPKCWERTTKKMSDLPTWSQPRALRLHHIAYQCLDRRGLMGWWVLPWRVKNPTSWRIHVLITSHNHLIFLFTTLLVHVIDSKNRSASQY